MFIFQANDGFIRYRFVVSSNREFFNVRDEMDLLNYGGHPAHVTVVVDPGINLENGSPTIAAFETGLHHSLTTLRMENNGRIVGRGGNGG